MQEAASAGDAPHDYCGSSWSRVESHSTCNLEKKKIENVTKKFWRSPDMFFFLAITFQGIWRKCHGNTNSYFNGSKYDVGNLGGHMTTQVKMAGDVWTPEQLNDQKNNITTIKYSRKCHSLHFSLIRLIGYKTFQRKHLKSEMCLINNFKILWRRSYLFACLLF